MSASNRALFFYLEVGRFMTLVNATRILFCHQTWQHQAQVQMCQATGGGHQWLITESTPFHPISHIWPDHPADKGYIEYGSHTIPVLNCLTGVIELSTNTLFVDKDIPVKRGEEGWVFVVVHQLDTALTIDVNEHVTLHVDRDYQDALSRGHSAGHLASLALNKVLHSNYWRKQADRLDELNHYDFNSYAQETSFVTEDRCVDTYRLGKTLRKRGLNSANVLEDLDKIAGLINEQLMLWLALGCDIHMDCKGPLLTDSRYWVCHLGEEGLVEMPCGGTHSSSFKDFTAIMVELVVQDEQYIQMITTSEKS